MRKIYFFTLLSAILFGVKVSAQTSLLGTLNHDGTITTYYGATALQQAHKAATHGDVITLSSGTFESVFISKAVTIRGAGMDIDTVSHAEPTVISGDFIINIADSISERLTMEGVYSNQTITVWNLKNAMFLKSRFYYFYPRGGTGGSSMNNISFIHCRITNAYQSTSPGSATFTNSIVMCPKSNGNQFYSSFTNCIILGSGGNLENSEYKNSIIVNAGTGTKTSSYYNNLFITNSNLTGMTNTTNVKVSTTDSIVANLVGDYSDSKTYELSEGAKALLKGTDGTEIGIYGGSLPYDPTPTNPQITKFAVAAKSTADGKLSVDIEVNSAE